MKKDDEIRINILSDGTIRMEADKISMASHASAEAFVREVSRGAGGTTNIKSKTGRSHHGHSHSGHEEEHHEH